MGAEISRNRAHSNLDVGLHCVDFGCCPKLTAAESRPKRALRCQLAGRTLVVKCPRRSGSCGTPGKFRADVDQTNKH